MNKFRTVLVMAAGVLLALPGCQEKVTVDSLTASFDISANPCYAGDEIHFTSTSTGGKKPYTCTWSVDGKALEKQEEEVKYVFTTNGTFTVKLSITDDLGGTASKQKLVVVNPAKVAETGGIEILWVGAMDGYNSITTPAVADDGSVYCSTRANKLYKFDKNGNKIFDNLIFTAAASGETYGTPSIDTDGTVFIGGGSKNKDGNFVAFNADGTKKWSFSEWYRTDGTNPEPAYQASIGGIGDKNVYFGCVGQNGIAVAVDKASGKRQGFVVPSGGCRTGLVLTSDGYVSWYGGKYGLFGIAQTTLDNGGATPVSSVAWKNWNDSNADTFAQADNMAGIAALTIDGKSCLAGTVYDKIGTRIYAVEAATGKVIANHYVEDNAAKQDQGGVAVTADGSIVAALAYTTGQDDGGIVVIDPKTADASGKCTVKGRYKVQEKVAGSPAVDKAGNIHFGTESGQYYVLDKDCGLVLKADLAKAVAAKDATAFGNLRVAKIWSSIVIGDDGTVYIAFTDNDDRTVSGVAAFKPYNAANEKFCTGPADSEWPMFGHDRRHTNRQL